MENKVINLINIKVENNKVEIESIYKEPKNLKSSIVIESNNNLEVKHKKVDFSKEYDVTKINVVINNIREDVIKFKIKESNNLLDTIILDNKNEEISYKNNEYIIFLNKYKIKVLKDYIKIERKNIFDKIIYELKKQLYSIKEHKKMSLIRLLSRKKKSYYLFNDRIMYADDNAEQLFKYINENDKNISKKCYFILDKNSPKYKQIKKYGKVLKFGSLQHKIKYINCKMVISSHASYFDRVYNPFNEKEMKLVKDLITKKFIFLQHGVIFNDVHEILNRPQIIADLFITTTNAEYNELLSSKYMYENEMIICTGLSRFDKLENSNNNVILIAPTWRAYLTDVKYRENTKQELEQSEYYIQYKNLLEDNNLIDKLKKYKFKIKFLLHPASIQFKNEFEKFNSENIEILTTDKVMYSELFKECSIFITDYSSTHFDIAYMKKPIIYYQFDIEKFYTSHYNKGYFEYDKDGFGDVVYKKEDLLNEITKYIQNECRIKKKYEDRINKTFKYIDKNNSKRIYEEIKKIDNNKEYNYRFNNVH